MTTRKDLAHEGQRQAARNAAEADRRRSLADTAPSPNGDGGEPPAPDDDDLLDLLASADGARSSGADDTASDSVAPFPTHSIGELARLVDAAPAPRFVVCGMLIEGDYGVLGATFKFGKSMLASDIALNVAAGGSVLGVWAVESPGLVLLFAGEGGRRKLVRRMRAIAEFYGLELDDLPIEIYERAPKLANAQQVERLRLTVERLAPKLVIIDPSYLALSGADTKDLTSMGVLLERVQIICQDAGAALLLTHHWNKTGSGTSADRFTGTGFAEWGRVLISGEVRSTTTNPVTGESSVVCRLEIIGDELAGTSLTYRRRVWADDPNDLMSAMHYVVTIVDDELPDEADLGLDPGVKLKPAALRVLAALQAAQPNWIDVHSIGDRLAATGHPLKHNTIYEACKALVEHGLANVSGGSNGIVMTWAAAS